MDEKTKKYLDDIFYDKGFLMKNFNLFLKKVRSKNLKSTDIIKYHIMLLRNITIIKKLFKHLNQYLNRQSFTDRLFLYFLLRESIVIQCI